MELDIRNAGMPQETVDDFKEMDWRLASHVNKKFSTSRHVSKLLNVTKPD